MSHQVGKIKEIALAQIEPNPDQPRKHFDEELLAALAASIQARGLIQPITVRPINKVGEEGRYMIVAGERRWRAHKLAGIEVIRCIVQKMTDDDMAVRAIIENLQRTDISPMEEAKAFQAMIDRGYTIASLMQELGLKSRNRVVDRLNLLKLDAQGQKLVERGHLAPAYACEIATLPFEKQSQMIRDVSAGKFRTAEHVRHACIAHREAARAIDMFQDLPKASNDDLAKLSAIESKIDRIVDMVASGFKDNECHVAKLVSPDRTKVAADKLALIRKHLLEMEHQLRAAGAQAEILQSFAA